MANVRAIRSNLKVVDHFEEDSHERAEVIVAGISDSFYQRPEEDDRVYFPVEVANNLLYGELVLEVMMKMGVHNWPDFEEAMNEVKRIWKGM